MFCIPAFFNSTQFDSLDPVFKVNLSVSSLQKSLEYWNKLLGMKIMKQSDTSAELAYSDSQVCCCFVLCVYVFVFVCLVCVCSVCVCAKCFRACVVCVVSCCVDAYMIYFSMYLLCLLLFTVQARAITDK